MVPSLYSPEKPCTLGILGGGQLAKMLAQAAYRMGLRVAVIEHGKDSPAGVMTQLEFPEGWKDDKELERFIQVSDIITLENEFIDPVLLARIAEKRLVFPTPQTMELVQDKYIQKNTMRKAGIPTPHFEKIDSLEEAYDFGERKGYPYILKTRKFGYDGYGNHTADRRNQATVGFTRFTSGETPRQVMAEEFVHFEKELAVMVARNRRGETAVYPCVETVQKNHICHTVFAPAAIPESVSRQAREIALAAVEAIEGVGVFGIELFLGSDGRVLFNEIAPRPHNSGHYTIEACYTSQFENCIRAVLNLPLGSADMLAPAAVMLNLLGSRSGPGIPDSVVDFLRHPMAALHLYGKKDSRVGRKMGHVTALGANPEEARQRAECAVDSLVW